MLFAHLQLSSGSAWSKEAYAKQQDTGGGMGELNAQGDAGGYWLTSYVV
jgi:hypothetical protein